MKEKNVSNLTKTLAVMSLLAPVTAQPLGIGDIELHSVLNQKLNAVIKLHLAGENPSDISVRLAPPEKFDQAGVPWSYFLSKIKLDPVVNADGSMLIKVTTNETFVEPFLNFLLEVSWPQGSLVREFTLLIDPPAEYQAPVFPAAENGYVSAEPLADERPVRQRSSRSSTRAARPASAISPQTPMDGEYRPTQAQDTLWRIADELAAKQGVSTAQMMNALFRANPDAFIRGDMDLLKVGAVLKIPETQAILQDSGAEKTSRPVAASKKPLELVTPVESNIAENAAAGVHAKTTAPNAATESATGNGKDLELQARIEKLEEQLNMMQQLLALKDQQLATLQSKDKTPGVVVASQPPSTSQPRLGATESPTVASPAPEAVKLPATITATAQPTLKPKPKATLKPVPTAVPLASDESDSGIYMLSIGALGTSILAVIGGLWWRKRKLEERTNSESMFASASQIKMPDADSALSVPVVDISNATAYDVGTVGESSFISDFTPSDFDAFDTDQSEVDPLSEADVYLAYGRYQQAEDLIRHAIRDVPERDDYKLKLLEILYANESKEAFAVYAQELSDAGKQADRVFWTKVSDMGKEIAPEFSLFGGAEHHLDAASQAVSDTSKDNAASASSSFTKETELDAFSHDDDLIDLNDASLPDLVLMDDINSELAELELDSDSYTKTGDNGLDFDLSSFSESASRNKEQVEGAAVSDAIETIDFDLSSLSLDAAEAEKKPADAVEDALESFDFNFDLAASDANSGAASKDAKGDAPLDMAHLESFDFPDFSSSSESALTTADEEAQSLESVSGAAVSASDEFDFNFDFDAPSAQDQEKDETELGVFDLTDMDEFETKIDLAKAYIDMGDTEAARNIAKEVLEKGTKEQKQAAQAILAEL